MFYQSEGTAAQSLKTGVPEGAIITTLRVINAAVIYMACCIAIAVWDCLSSIQLEYQAIWKKQWSFVKCVYIISRYTIFGGLGLSIHLWTGSYTADQCQRLFHLIPAFVTPTAVAGEVILLMRVYALSGKQAWLIWTGGFIQVGYLVVCIYISVAGMKAVPIFQERDYCVATGGPKGNIMLAYWIVPMVFDAICTGLMFYYIRPYFKNGTASNIIRVFVREGVLYFLVVTIANSVNVAFSLTDIPNQAINDAFSLTMTSIMSCRLVLSLHDQKATAVHSNGGTSFWSGRSGVMTGPVPMNAERTSVVRKKPPMLPSDSGIGLTTTHGGASQESRIEFAKGEPSSFYPRSTFDEEKADDGSDEFRLDRRDSITPRVVRINVETHVVSED